MESFGKHLDKLTEVYTLVGYIIEYGFVAVTLILHVANLHLQVKALGYLSALYHRSVFAALGLAVFFHIHGLGYAVYALDVVGRLQVGFLYLQLNELAGKRNHTNVVSGISLNGNNVALSEVEIVYVVIISLAGVLKLHLNKVGALGVARNVGQPVVSVELAVLTAASSQTQTTVAPVVYKEFLVF